MANPQILTKERINQLHQLLIDEGINAAAAIYQELSNLGYGYAGWAYGVATGETVTGQGALLFMQSRAEQNNIIIDFQKVNDIRLGMLSGYLDILLKKSELTGFVNEDVKFKETLNFHVEVFKKYDLDINYWTLQTPMSLVKTYLGGDNAQEEAWAKIRDTDGTGLDALFKSLGLVTLVEAISQGVIYLDGNGDIVRKIEIDRNPELILSGNLTKIIISQDDINAANEWASNVSAFSPLWKYINKDIDAKTIVGDQNELGQNDYILLVNPITDSDRKNIVFGLGGKDTIYGESAQDRLYGGNADDELYGKDGGDYLYGGLDNDKLYGGNKNDYLNGGKGDDILDGGEDNDILVDEFGDDTYIFNGNFGYDKIYDVDGKGKIKINGEILKVGEKQNDVLWLSEDGKYYINLQKDFDGVAEMKKIIITAKNTEEDQNTIVIKNWKNSHLGISLTEAESPHGSPITIGIGTNGDDYITDSVYFTDGSGFTKDIRSLSNYIYNPLTDRFSVQSLIGNDSIVLDDKNYLITLGGGQVKKVITGDGHIMVLASNASDQIFTGAGSDSILLENDPSSFYQKKPEEFEVIYENKTTYKFYSDRYNFASTGAGKDLIVGGITKDIVYAGDHEDIVSGGGGNDEIYGENGNDIIYGDNHVLVRYQFMRDRWDVSDTASNANDLDMERLTNPYLLDSDVIEPYANTNWGYHGVDRIYGGKGDDRIFGNGGTDYLYGGDDNDIISGDFTYFVRVQYVGITLDENGVSTVTEEENKQVLDAASRHRYEFSGDDYLDGGLGNDRLLGGLKNDQLYGGEGDDWIYGDSDLLPEIFVNSNLDRSIFNLEWVTQLADDERFTKIYSQFVDKNNNPLWTANDYVEGGKGKDYIFTEEGNDTAYGGADDDVIYGDWSEFEVKDKYHGNDILHGDDGKDIIYGDGGDDQVFGGNDNDLLYGDGKDQEGKWHGNDKLFGGNGDDQILGQGGNDEIDGGDGKEYINGDDDKLDGQWHGKDKIWGGNGQDYIIGNGKADVIYGGDGIDKIYGDSDILDKAWHGDDELYGDSGNDIIYAGGGNDKITGGIDHDQLYGGEGNDEYYFKKGDGQDIIFETSGQDKIIFDDINSNEVFYFRMKDHLIITGYHQGDLISISDFFKDNNNDKKIESIVFQDKEVNISSMINEPNKILDLPYDETTSQSYAVVEKKTNNDSIEINNKEKAVYIIKGFDNSLQINDSENIILVGSGDDANNYYGHNSNNLKITGGNGTDYYRFTGEMDVYLNDANHTGIIEMSTLSNYFEWKYDISCYGWFISKSPAEMNLVTSGEYANHYKINENSTRLNEVIYDASSGKLLIQNNTSSYVNARGPGESQTLPVIPDIVPYEKKVQANIFLENLFSRNDVDVAMSSMQVHLGEYSYSLAGQKTVVIDAVTLSLQDYINQGHVTAYYTTGDDFISGLTNKIRSEHYSDRLENYFETVYAGAGNDQINLGLGSSVIYAESGNDHIIALDITQVDVVYGGEGNDVIYNFDPLNKNQINTYSSSVDLIYGGEGDDAIYINYQYAEVYGGDGNDRLYAGDHGAYLNGGSGIDYLFGGLGDDTFIVDEYDIYEENDPNGGYDTIITLSNIDLIQTNFEAVILLGDGNFNIHGNAENNRLIGNDGNNYLDGRMGSDYMAGGLGDDYYVIDRTDTVATNEDGNTHIVEGDEVVEDSNKGIDTIERWQDARFIGQDANGNPILTNNNRLLEENIENLILKGNAKTAFGNELNNIIVGNSQDNYIDGLEGDDTYVFAKGGGTDTYNFEDSINAVNILKIQGYSTNDVFAQKYGNSVYLSFKGTNDHIWLSNYALADTANKTYKMDQIIFDSGAIWTSTDIDILVNRAATNHAPTVNAAIPTINSNQGAGFSYKFASNVIVDQDSWDYLSYKVTLSTKDSSGQYQAIPTWLTFDPATQTLSGTLPSSVTGNLSFFYWGTDMYGLGTGTSFTLKVNPPNQAPIVLNAIADQSFTDAKAFSYTIPSTAFKDPDGDALTYTATLEDGSALPSWLTFNATTCVLSGTAPESTAPLNIKIIAKDTANQSVSDIFKVSFVVQNLTLSGTSSADTLYGGSGNDSITGLAGNDILYGQSGNDTLDGGAGNDTLYGGKGDDIYVVDSISDSVNENSSEGIDTVQSSVTYTLSNANVENLTLTGTSAINATGNALNNVLTGNSGNNTLTGGAGNDTLNGGAGTDTLIGGLGDDLYIIDSTTDTLTENTNEGTDMVQSSVTYTLGNNLENLILTGTSAINGTGNTLNNTITGNSAGNTLSGGTGADTLIGGLGDDIYVIDNTSDIVIENTSEGTDSVQSSVTYGLSANVENLTLTGTTAINGTGNELNNVLTGNSANNTLIGGAGNDTFNGGAGTDTLIGGLGDDLYIVDSTTDTLTENANEGTDTVQSSVTYTLGNNIENLTLTGTTAINATGNALNNILIGNSAVNTLTGGAGDDYLDGGAGNDKLLGGLGNDTYVVDSTSDTITENTNEGIDAIRSSVTLTLGNNLENLTLTGTSAINGTGNALNNTLIGNTAVNTLTGGAGDDYLDGGTGADKLLGGTGNDSYVIDNTGDVVTENTNEGIDTVLSSITYTLGNNLENLTLTGSTAINATGNTLNNTLIGNNGANVLNSGAGNDILDGQGGNDQYTGGTGADTLVYNLLVASDVFGGNGSDIWSDFTIGNTTTNANADKIDISDLLIDYAGDYSVGSLTPYLNTIVSGSNTQLYIDRDGGGSVYSSSLLLTLNNTNTSLNDLINNHQIV